MGCKSHVTKQITLGVIKRLKLSINNTEIKQLMWLKFCLSEFVVEVNLFLEYRKNLIISILFRVDLTWNYPCISFVILCCLRISYMALLSAFIKLIE